LENKNSETTQRKQVN